MNRFAVGTVILTLVAGIAAVPATATTIQNFDSPGTPYTFGHYLGGSYAAVTGPDANSTGQFARLNAFTLNTDNTMGFDRTDPGPIGGMVADFNFRVTCAGARSGYGCADGFSFVLLNTATAGITGAAPALDEAGRSNITNFLQFGVGFNTFNNGGGDANSNNSMNLSFNNAIIGGSPIDLTPLGLDLATGINQQIDGFIQAHIDLTLDGPSPSITVQLTRGATTITPYNNFSLAGLVIGGFALAPYEGRIAFATRSGSGGEAVDIDNLAASFRVATIPAPASLPLMGLGLGVLGLARRRR